jgi:hypothetical protein
MKNIKKYLMLFFAFTVIHSCTYEDLDDAGAKDLISVDSELYQTLQDVAKDPAMDENAISCILIVYPISMFTYDANNAVIANTLITDNSGFSAFLDTLPITHSISISFPIAATLADGTQLSITTNEELKESIDDCIENEEELIGNCQALIDDCIWKVGYSQVSNNNYLGATLFVENGATTFSYSPLSAFGSWTAIFIENELYININLNGNISVENDFNRNWKVAYLDADTLKLTDDLDELILNQYCNVPTDECFDFNFTACEDNTTPGFATILLDDYSFCIYQILQQDDSLISLSFYRTLIDADNGINPIDTSAAFSNTSLIESYLVRVTNTTDSTYYIIQISVTVESCL